MSHDTTYRPRCSVCTTPLRQQQQGRYCSVSCRQAGMAAMPRVCPTCARSFRRLPGSHRRYCSATCRPARPSTTTAAVLAILRATTRTWLTPSDLAIWVRGDDTPTDIKAIRNNLYRLRLNGYVLETRTATWVPPVHLGRAVAYRLIATPAAQGQAA